MTCQLCPAPARWHWFQDGRYEYPLCDDHAASKDLADLADLSDVRMY